MGRRRAPQDGYIAPEMKNWTPVFRFGHDLLIRTKLKLQTLPFLIDTGSEMNLLSPKAASQVGKTSDDPDHSLVGLSGTVNKIQRAQTATLQFSHFAQTNEYMMTVDLSRQSSDLGTELSGVFGFELLRLLRESRLPRWTSRFHYRAKR